MAIFTYFTTAFTRLSLIVVPALAFAASDAQAKPSILDMLKDGDHWTLTADKERARLTLLGGKSGKTKNGGWQLHYKVKWGNQIGSLRARSDAKNSVQQVTFKLTRKNGIKLVCNGYLARETDALMAGTCNEKAAPTPWYATKGAMPASEKFKARYLSCRKNEQVCQAKRRKLDQLRGEAQNRYVAEINAHNRCKSKQKSCPSKPAKGTSASAYKSFRDKISGRHGYEKSQTSTSTFPGLKPGSSLHLWLKDHVAALQQVTYRILPSNDHNDFRNYENQRCINDLYCKIGLHQQAISCALGYGC